LIFKFGINLRVFFESLFALGLVESSLDCFQLCVLPLMADPIRMDMNLHVILSAIAKTISQFKNDQHMKAFRNFVKPIPPKDLQNLIALFKKDKDLCSYSAIQDLFKLRFFWLVEQVKAGASLNIFNG